MNEIIRYDQEGKSVLGAEGKTVGKDKVKNELFLPCFASLPGLWTFVPDEYYDDAINYAFGDTARIGEYALFVAKLDAYHAIQKNTQNNLNLVLSKGVTLTIVSNYNTHIAPVSPKSKTLTGDVTIETVGTSAGATTAPIGETFPEDYTQAKFTDKDYISPDNMIDASTCMFPDRTWFIKDMKHLEFDREGNNCDVYIWLATADEQYTVDTDDLYPQFLMYNRELKRLSCFYTLGDVNYDGEFDLTDVRAALRIAEGLGETNANLEAAADYNENGEVAREDSQSILEMVANIQAEDYKSDK